MTIVRPPPHQHTDGGPDPAPGGRARTIRFPPYWQAWFARQTAPRLTAIDELVDALATEHQAELLAAEGMA